ncbi:hypothetical protein [Arthrobacter gandavensis]|uniref:hypothetical protein n=1 Tax=Arthrobacter gandavensis TaxID=169960 RepID=UPI001E5076D3|nr:hypothetical protein [Arthrobacter gandavensis]
MTLSPFGGQVISLSIILGMLAGSGEGTGDLGSEGNVQGNATFYQDPTSGAWATFQVGLPDDPMQYKYEAACFDEDNGDIDCFVRYGLECNAGPNGRLVWWSSALKGDDNPVWERLSEAPTCIYSEDPAAFQERLREAILRALQEAPIAPGTVTLQPSPHTLIGAHTNVYAEAQPQVFDMELLGQSIRIEVEPTEYTFSYGDGTVHGPVSTPGGPLPEARWGEQTSTSHRYSQTGDVPVSITTFFSGRYSVNGGPMIPIDGRAEVASPSQVLSVWRSESRNVADNCLVNPTGVGC